MKLTKKLEAEIRKLYETFWESYINGDLETYASFLDEEFKFIGSTEAEPLLNKKDSIKFLEATAEQLRGNAEFRNRNIKAETVDDLILITELCDGYIRIGSEWNFYSRFRLSSLLKKKKEGWKFIHQHVSMPDSKAQEGESFGLEQIRTENIQLRDAIKRRTVELENKNRELEIEAALEKVRVQALGMHKPDDLLNVCKILFKELQVLGFNNLRNAMIDTFVDEKKYLLDYDFSDFTGGSITCNPYSGSPVMEKFISEIRKSNDAFTEIAVTGKELEEWKQFRIANNEKDDPRLDNISGLYYYFYSIGVGAIGISTFSSINEEKREILKRFRNVFDFAYRRYMDVAQAEAQAREAKIEAGLERARTQSMLMQRSNELNDTLQVFHQQLQLLGINSDFSYLWLPDEENDKHVFWATWEEEKDNSTILKSKTLAYPLDRDESYTAQCLADWKSGIPVHTYKLPPAEIENYFAAWQELLSGAEKLKAEFFPDGFDYVEAFMKYGCFGIVVRRLLTEDEKQVLRRFTIEFERAYTRFLDLQKAEAQTREAKIEAALEKVRSRSLAMHKSDELGEIVSLVIEKLKDLEIKMDGALINIYTEGSKDQIHWMVAPDLKVSISYKLPYIDHAFIIDHFDAKESGLDFFQKIYSYEEQHSFHKYIFEHTDYKQLPDEIKKFALSIKTYAYSIAISKYSAILLYSFSGRLLSEREAEILKRFARVFEQAYIRFLDLQNAEAQAREAQIEAALERVRSRSMGMQKSEELKEVIQVVYEQFGHLNIHVEHTGFIMDYKTRDDMHIWLADKHVVPFQVVIPYFDCAHWNSFNEAKEKGIDFFSNQLSFEEKNKFYQDLFKLIPGVPEETLEYYFSCPGLAISTVLLENVGLYIENFSGIPFTDEENNTLMRFGKVFQQTYTRFLDLQKAEAQAREAQIEVSLERVRSKAMAMHKTEDLTSAVSVVFDELDKLQLGMLRCGIGILHRDKRTSDVWTTAKSETGSNIQTSGDEPMDIHPLLQGDFDAWLRQEDFSYILEGKDLENYYQVLTETNFQLPESASFETITKDHKQYYYVTPFELGTFFAFRNAEFTPEAKIVMKRFANVFNLTYKRFLDLQKAEAQAREGQIELGLERVRARAMAMQKSDELSELVDTVFKELTKLDFALTWCIINIIDESSLSNTVWAANPDINKPPESYHMLFEDYPFHHAMMKGWKERKTKYVYVLEGTEKRIYDEYLFNETEFRRVPVAAQAASRAMEKYVVTFSFSNFGGLQTVGDVPLSDANLDILSRFGKVFDLTYTRFNDLKQAEAQAREAKIEAALERVRSRAMAMHKTDELLDAAELVSKELSALGITSMNVSYAFVDDDEKYASYYSVNPVDGKVLSFPFVFPHTETEVMRSILSSWKKQEPFNLIQLDEEATLKHQTYIGEHIQNLIIKNNSGIPFSVEAFLAVSPKKALIYTFNFAKGYLFNIGGERLTTMQEEMVLRFTKVFDMTYRRFLDLKQAEAQAREAQIQLAMERVRARTMAMQKSDELAEAASLLFSQIADLGTNSWSSGFIIFQPDELSINSWMSKPDGSIGVPFNIPVTEDPFFIKIYEAYKRGEEFFVLESSGKELEETYKYMFSLPGAAKALGAIEDLGFQMPIFQITHCVFFPNGFLMFITYEPCQEMWGIFKRFGKVFEQTYTRFLDLQKAEAQIRESKIEAALEKVRSRTMAMQRSSELAEVATVLFQQVKALGVPQWTCGFGIFEIDDKEFTWYQGSADGEILPPCKIPLTEHPVFIQFNESRKRGDGLYIYEKTGEIQADHYRYMCSLPVLGKLLQDRLDAGIQFPTFQIDHIVNFSHGNLVFITYEHFPEMHDVFKRFAKVFDQTYTRFLDLQKAEAQAREAIKQASVDRIRAEIASMRTTNDLERIQPIIWNELTTLGVPFTRCGVFIMDEEHEQVDTFLSTPDGRSIASFTSNYSDVAVISEALPYWRRKEIYKAHWDEATFLAQAKTLLEQGNITSTETYLTEHRPKDLYLHFLPFLQGILYVGNETPLNDDELQLVQNLADAFSIAYARYEDFNKLELAKGQIEKTLVDLKQTQAQLVQSEKMASLGELTAGIAHEIQNPLNFVNNFSDVNKELLVEMKDEIEKGNIEEVKAIANDIIGNEEKISHHGKRADAIVKGMLQHSRSSSGVKEAADINVLADEYLRLAYHGLRAKDKFFNATMKTEYDESIGKIDIVPQDIGRSVLNLITNAFYAVAEKKKQNAEGYEPTVTVTTKRINGKIEIRVADNGNGIPQKVLDKIFQPFFTTKPTGQGTGLGLSLSYDIIKAHGGEINVETKEGQGSEFFIFLPANN